MRSVAVLLAGICFALIPAEPAAESSGGGYTLRKQVFGSGGESSSARYRVLATVAEVGAGESASNRYLLIGGFHPLPYGLGASDRIFCDGFESSLCP